MSHRESCVWHPMPDEVRRSSVQSRRASLAAGRRKQMQDEPDWEVEAPPTPPPNDYSPRQDAADAAEAAARNADEAQQNEAEAAAVEEAALEAEAAESREPVEEARHEPVEEKSAAEAAQEREVAAAEAADAAAADAEASAEEEAAADGKRAKTRHTIRFRGDKWASVTDAARRQAAFEEDVADAAGLTPDQLRSLKFEVEPEMMVATFYVSHAAADREKMRAVHHKFQEASFTHTCALYPE